MNYERGMEKLDVAIGWFSLCGCLISFVETLFFLVFWIDNIDFIFPNLFAGLFVLAYLKISRRLKAEAVYPSLVKVVYSRPFKLIALTSCLAFVYGLIMTPRFPGGHCLEFCVAILGICGVFLWMGAAMIAKGIKFYYFWRK